MTELTKKRTSRSDDPDPIDIHVGARLRLRRNLLGLSQEQLGRASHLTFQQIQKYERGTNRMGASRLYQMAQILDVAISWFYDSLPEDGGQSLRRNGHDGKTRVLDGAIRPTDGSLSRIDGDPILHRRETADLLRSWYRIPDPKQRRKIMDLIKSMGEETAQDL